MTKSPCDEITGKQEHYTAVGEPGSYYLTHFSPEHGKGRTIAQKLFDSFSGTELEGKFAIVGTDGTASMTGKHNGLQNLFGNYNW